MRVEFLNVAIVERFLGTLAQLSGAYMRPEMLF